MSDGRNMFVFRSGRRTVETRGLVEELAPLLDSLVDGTGDRASVLEGFLRAGELECGLADAALPTAPLAEITDRLADALVCGALPTSAALALRSFRSVRLPKCIEMSPAEGFAYYGLHPLDYADLAAELPRAGAAVVVGVRTIGTPLSAIVAAALRRRGVPVRRTTVRPTGHPYRRRARFSPSEELFLRGCPSGTAFVVVDEGPGCSGSSLLSVAEELERIGVPRAAITLLHSRPVDPDTLVGVDAPAGWRRYASVVSSQVRRVPADATRWLGAGRWRELFFSDEAAWPASWTEMERLKFLSTDGQRLYKFEGYGRYGREVRARAAALVEGGFLPPGSGSEEENGFVAAPFLRGRPLAAHDLDERLLTFLADYCAFRAKAFAEPAAEAGGLEAMIRIDGNEELGWEPSLRLETRRPVLCDGRMLPHELFRDEAGATWKLDALTHGDDHFLPGIVDVAWDLAGVIFEWDLSPAAEEAFLERYRRQSGDDPRRRIAPFVFAYGLFRTASWSMALASMGGSPEAPRLAGAYERARAHLDRRATRAGLVRPAGSSGAADRRRRLLTST